MRDMVAGDVHKAPTEIWLGTNSAAATATDTVGTMTGTYTKIITARAQTTFGISFQVFIGSTEANGVTYNEAGLVTTRNGSNTLFARIKLLPIVKTSSVTVTLTWTITMGAA